MANWYGAARSNYVSITDVEAVEAIVSPFGIEMSQGENDKWAFFPSNDTDGDFNYSTEDEDGDEIEFAWDEVMAYVPEGEVLVVMCSGAEKLRFITGEAFAICRKGAEVNYTCLRLYDIYKQAATNFNVDIQTISVAEY
jgi:hypothetical protein